MITRKLSVAGWWALVLLASGCGSSPEPLSEADDIRDGSVRADYSGDLDLAEGEGDRERTFDEDRAREDAEADLAADTYSGIGRPYGCTQDCSGHEAGYAYARDRDSGEDPGYYGGRSPSFAEGRRAYHEELEERVGEARADFEDGDDEFALEE